MTFYSETLKPRLQQARVLVVGDVMLDRYWFGAQRGRTGRAGRIAVRHRR